MKFWLQKNQSGFTFLELIVVFSVMAIVATVGVVSFNEYNKSQEVSGAVSDIVNVLNLAKSNSRSQITSQSCKTLGYTLDRYRVTMSVNPSNLVLEVDCIDSLVPPNYYTYGTGDNPNKPLTVTMPENVEITGIVDNTSTENEPEVFFYPLFQERVDGGQICIEAHGGSINRAIDVNELGTVTILNPGDSQYLCP